MQISAVNLDCGLKKSYARRASLEEIADLVGGDSLASLAQIRLAVVHGEGVQRAAPPTVAIPGPTRSGHGK